MSEEKMFIDGEWVEGAKGWANVLNPADNTVLARVAAASREDAEHAVQAAKIAFPGWKRTDGAARGALLLKVASAIRAARDDIAKLETENQGKTFREAKADVTFAAWTFEYYAGLADKVQGETIPVPGDRLNYTIREPLGVTSHIVPWNYPFQLACRSIAPALAAGNTVVAKPASHTPLSLLRLARITEEAGIPKGVFNVVTGSGGEVGPVLAGHRDVAAVVLTGSVDTGQEVLKEAAKNVTPVTLELGGKSPNIVFPDANLDKAVKGVAFGIFLNAGQMCWAGSRALVHESIHDEFVEKLVAFAGKMKLGPGLDKDTRMGPLVSEGHLKTVMEYVDVGRKEGATLACGGKRSEDAALAKGNFLEPAVFTDVTPKMRIAREEIFGPVLAVMKFSTDEEALGIANGVDFGLYAGVWTNNLQRAHRFARDLEAGMVSVNEYPVTFPQSPFGGFKQSGIGSEQGTAAMEFYTRRKTVFVNLG